MPSPVGAPPRYSDPAVMEARINSYFASRDDGQYCITELLCHLDIGFDAMADYMLKPIFGDLLKKAKLRIASTIERRAVWSNSPGAMFWLKCNLGWAEVQRVEQEISYSDDVTAAGGWARTKGKRNLKAVGST